MIVCSIINWLHVDIAEVLILATLQLGFLHLSKMSDISKVWIHVQECLMGQSQIYLHATCKLCVDLLVRNAHRKHFLTSESCDRPRECEKGSNRCKYSIYG